MMKLEDRRVLLTGATGGIGSALARQLGDDGAWLLLLGRNRGGLERLAQEVGTQNCDYMTGDLTDPCAVARVAQLARDNGIDTLVNNAGINEFRLFGDVDIDRVVRTNVTAPMHLTQALLPHLTALPAATIVNVGSTFGSIGYPGYVAYCASKHAIKGFSEALRRELADTNVDVIYASPRATATGMNSESACRANSALGIDSDSAEIVAGAIVRMMSTRRSRMQIGWPEKLQVKINALFPGLVDHAIVKQLPIIKQYANQRGNHP